ncbi:ferredoxin [Paenarthrobacter histidinolovorans]|uniref:ferredoxin n=1 Tax=Paenarthrobacter histidinolovorans TaxID=43664 RepID=UPI00166C0DAE|nr:ferredoxin [Paenarthrobacter histidinolovorans]GGJ22140.1 ferredoxin [Paenarthrobacter histidinolovorans]
MKFDINVDKCVGAGVCAIAAPEVFDQNDDDGIIVVLDPNPPLEQAQLVHDAATRCPAAVITNVQL